MLRLPDRLALHDISREGRALVSKNDDTSTAMTLPPGAKAERNLSWHGDSMVEDISPDGATILFREESDDDRWGEFIRKTDGSPAVRLGDGLLGRLSPDGKWVACLPQVSADDKTPRTILLPTGAGEPRVFPIDTMSFGWLPDSSGILFVPVKDKSPRTYLQPVDGGKPAPVTPEGVRGTLATPDGNFLLAQVQGQGWFLYPLKGGEKKPARVPGPPWAISGWHSDGKRLRVIQRDLAAGTWTAALWDLASGKLEPWKQNSPITDRAGLRLIGPVRFSADGSAYAYFYARRLWDSTW